MESRLAEHNLKSGMNIDRAMHVLNAVVLAIAALYFVFQLEKQGALLAQSLDHLNQNLKEHSSLGAHSAANQHINELARNVDRLVGVVDRNTSDIAKLQDQ